MSDPVIQETIADVIMKNIPVIVPTISAGVAAAGLIFSGLSYRMNAKSRYYQTLKELEQEVANLEDSQERNKNYPSFAAKYLNLHERIAKLTLKGIISKDIARYFNSSFAACLALLEKDQFKKYVDDLSNLTEWCEKEDIEAGDVPEPHVDTNVSV